MKRLAIYLLALLPLGIVVTLAYAQIRADTLFPWASGLAIPGLQIGIRGPNARSGTPMAHVLHGTCGSTFGSISPNVCATQSCVATGLAEDDRFYASLEDACDGAGEGNTICYASAAGAGSFTTKCCNITAGALTPGVCRFTWLAIRP